VEDALRLSTNGRTRATDVCDRLRAVANRPETGRNGRDRGYIGRGERLTGLERANHGFGLTRTGWRSPERWLETTSSRSRAAANGCGGRRTRHGSTRPDRWGSMRLACGCRPAADGVGPARGGALRPPDARRRLEDVAVRESSASARLWRGSHRLETQPSEEPVSPIGDRRSDHSGGRRRTTHRGASGRPILAHPRLSVMSAAAQLGDPRHNCYQGFSSNQPTTRVL
jgi:hypothetical protein